MPSVGLGTWKLSGEQCKLAVKHALQTGYRHIDTASMYRNEQEIGEGIASSDIPRDDVFITSKVWRTELGGESTEQSFHDTLDYLNTDYLDLYLIHWPGTNVTKRLDTYGKMMELRDAGKIKSIGVSNFYPSQIDDIYQTHGEYPTVNQIRLNPFQYNEETVSYCKDKNIRLTAYTPLNKGEGLNTEPIRSLAAKYDKSVYQIVIRWFIDLEIVTIPKSGTKDHIEHNFDVFDFELEEDEISSLIGI